MKFVHLMDTPPNRLDARRRRLGHLSDAPAPNRLRFALGC
ncbi:hypothetical protein I551_8129 [Mycobacterium ulcerans str. Harvey]|uniref:Uncharacterized protein n=1 Tax=Mycobacterium ulcerans str. Harvey TaxID=1299332 RepID=A0ABN0QLR4_MYCUL|nr:hypothetical protein I551_8129 [Mycobacterium ulcerans str. Harvey]